MIRNRCEHGEIIDPAEPCPWCECDRLRIEVLENLGQITQLSEECTRLRALNAELVEALHAWNSACHIDPMMEGPRFRGVSPTLAQKAYNLTSAALTKAGESNDPR